MRFNDDQPVDLINPGFQRKDLRRAEQSAIEKCFDVVASVAGIVNDGKEATVYLCRTRDGGVAAAKMYRARRFRAFANAKTYVDTRAISNRRAAKAVRQSTRKGKRMNDLMWVDREWQALNRLFAAGAPVPAPLARADAGVLMEYIGDERGAAPLLVDVVRRGLPYEALHTAWSACLTDVATLLACDLIHGDLSGYNVLWWQGRPRLIDLPQAMDPRGMANAFELLHRDLANLARPFERAGLTIDTIAVATDLARRYL